MSRESEGGAARSPDRRLPHPFTQTLEGQLSATSVVVNELLDAGSIYSTRDGVNPKVRFDYTALGAQSSRVPETALDSGYLAYDRQMLWAFEPSGKLRWSGDLAGQRTITGYDEDGNATLVTEAGGITMLEQKPLPISQSYDAFGRLSQVSQPKWNTTGCTLTTTLGYDADGNLTSRAENAESGSCGTVAARTHTFTVDALGRPTVQVDDGGTTGGGTPWTDDRRILWTYDSQSGLDLEREIQKATGASSWSIEQKQVKTWFDNGLLKTLKTLGPSANVLEEHTLSYETSGVFMDGFRTQDAFKLVGPSGQSTSCESSACTASWTYDARGRLTQEVTGTGTTSSFVLDAIGNVTSETIAGTTTTKAYTGQRLTSTTTGTLSTYYLYDASGNLSCVAGNSGCTSGVVSKHEYDYRNRMIKETTGGGSSATYIHDPLDRPVAVLSGGSTVTRYYAGASTDVTKECVGACSSYSKSYGYTALGERIFLTENTSGSETRYSYGFDPHTSVTQLIDQSGAVKQSYGYTAYGAANLALTKTALGFDSGVNPYRYTGHRLDALTGTMDMGARRYLPAAGRFIQQDMYYGGADNIGLSGDETALNRYGLAGGNPVNFVELDGHRVVPVGGAQESRKPAEDCKPGGSGAKKPKCLPKPPPPPPARPNFQFTSPMYQQADGNLTGGNQKPGPTVMLGGKGKGGAGLGLGLGGIVSAVATGAANLCKAACDFADDVARQGKQVAKGGKAPVEGTHYPLSPKIQGQVGKRGWTTDAIDEALQSGKQVRAVNKATGNPATRYIHPKTGQSVVIDDVTGQVIHVGGPGFKYGAGSGDVR